MQELIMQGMQEKKDLKSPAFDARRTLGMSNQIIEPPKYLIIIIITIYHF